MKSFFPGEYPELREKIRKHIDETRSSLQMMADSNVHALLLGGGYGRGEGGILKPDGEAPRLFNDFDYFLFCNNPDAANLLEWVKAFELRESQALGLDVEVKCLRRETLGNPSRSMMFYDLVAGHEVVFGPVDYLGDLAVTLDSSQIDLVEATRLLWNRGSGLYFSRCRLSESSLLDEDLEFIVRNHQKCKLALGDALLCLHGQYTASCRERHERLLKLNDPLKVQALVQWHNEGVSFKFDPDIPGSSNKTLLEENQALSRVWQSVYLAIESRRLGHSVPDGKTYATMTTRIFPDHGKFKCMLLALRDGLKRGGILRPILDYPRSALMRSLVLLLDDDWANHSKRLNRLLPARVIQASGVQEWEASYRYWWQFYS